MLEIQDKPELEISDQWPLIDAMAITEGIAVEKYVAPDGARLEAGEKIPADPAARFGVEETAAMASGVKVEGTRINPRETL